jgi:hypothetical protein
MKVRIGYQGTEYGTVEDTPDGLKFDGNAKRLRAVVEDLRRKGQSDEDLLADIPRQLNNGYWWSQDTAREGQTDQQG